MCLHHHVACHMAFTCDISEALVVALLVLNPDYHYELLFECNCSVSVTMYNTNLQE